MSTVTEEPKGPSPCRASEEMLEHSLRHNQVPLSPNRTLTLADLAKHSCPKCHGRGYTGIDSATGKKIVCRCALKTYAKVRQALVADKQPLAPVPLPKKKGLFARIKEKLRF